MGGFNFTARMRLICEDMVGRLDELSHIDLSRVAVAFTQARNRSQYGMYASLTPLRFKEGNSVTIRKGRRYTVQRVLDESGREMLYILTFYLPRFLDLSFREKLITVVHELWHISPRFDGDIRRHPGRCFAHSHSQEEYDREMGVLIDRWLGLGPPPELFDFLQHNFDCLTASHPRIVGTRISRPKLVPLP